MKCQFFSNAKQVLAFKWAAVFSPVLLSYAIPPPSGLSNNAWCSTALYIAALLGVIIKPVQESAVVLILASISCLQGNTKEVLMGFSNETVWLVFSAFMLGAAFVNSGLGKRVAFLLIKRFGNTTLKLGYIMVLLDLLLSPAIPSSTARSGGIVYPIFADIPHLLKTGKQSVAAYFCFLQYWASIATSVLFVTACSPNVMTVSFGEQFLHESVSWSEWAAAMALPGMGVLLTVPLILHFLFSPASVSSQQVQENVSQYLKPSGPPNSKEKLFVLLFVAAIIGWLLGDFLSISTVAVALVFLACSIFLGIISWEDIQKQKDGWSTFIWYGFILGFMGLLNNLGVFFWLTEKITRYTNLQKLPMIVLIVLLTLFCMLLRYYFVSMAAYVSVVVPVLFLLSHAVQLPTRILFFIVAALTSYTSLLTHYGTALGPILYAKNLVGQKRWWKTGLITCVYSISIFLLIGLVLWKFKHIW